MEFPIHIDTISIDVFQSLKVVLIANSADPDEMQHYAAFPLGLICLSEYPFWGFQNPVSNRQ